MEFHINGVPEPIALPDERFTFPQFCRLQRFLFEHPEAADADLTHDLELAARAISAVFEYPSLLDQLDSVEMTPEVIDAFSQIIAQLFRLAEAIERVKGDEALEELKAEEATESREVESPVPLEASPPPSSGDA